MNDFDDDQLRNEFDRRAGRGVSVAAAHDAVLARAGLVRRRRVAAGSGALIVLALGGLVLLPGSDGDSQAPSDSGEPIPSVEDDTVIDDLPTSTAAPDPDRSEVDDGAVPPPPTDSTVATVPPSTTLPAVVATTSNTPVPTRAASTTTAPAGGSSATTTADTSGSSSSTSSSSSSSSTPEPSVAPFTRSYDSTGGSISVDWNGTSFTLLSVAPAPGFEAEIEDQRATRIRVRFRGDDDDSRIEVRVENGLLTVDIS